MAQHIKILNSEVINQIAAGEVVERPAHLVKELIENSIDAGATEIEVDFSSGGRYVRVTDNGRGILPSELALAFERFATSKIEKAEDLWKLGSFGFRGEALASISSVSRLSLHSNSGEGGHRILSGFGKVSKVDPVSRSQGTTIIVEDLFENTPARLKFLKSETAEHTQIKSLIKGIAISNPQVEFRIHQKGELVLFFAKANSLKERVEQVLEISPLYFGEAQRGDVHAEVYFADPNTTAKSSRSIWIFAQGRLITDRGAQSAVMEAYRNLLMHGEYPIVAVFITTSPENVDVNIHPTKSQVKFASTQDVFRSVQAALRESLERAPWLQSIVGTGVLVNQPPVPMKIETPEPEILSFKDQSFNLTTTRQKDFSYFSSPQVVAPMVSPSLKLPDFQKAAPEKAVGQWSQLEILGQAHLTYIICQNEKGIIFVDQHAAHERVAFEKLMSAWQGGNIEVQQFLFPLSVDLSEEKVEAILRSQKDLEKIGIHIESLGPSVLGVQSGPILLKDQVIAEELDRLAIEIIDKGDSFLFERVIGDVFARMACHSVVRAGQSLSKDEMRSLLGQMDEHPLSTFCPHGRPVYVEYPFNKLEKDFGRTL